MDWSGDLTNKVELADALKSPKFKGQRLARLQDQGSKFVLNLSEGADFTITDDFSKLFYQDSTGLRTWVLYYNNGEGLLEELTIPKHKLPWKKSYRLPLQHCFPKNNPSQTLQWVVSIPRTDRRTHPRGETSKSNTVTGEEDDLKGKPWSN
ncbi:hypothetical protein LY76DRAFT_651655 [Colletotrichum caudatum]|nr:hypothetical protein LY76DRAFT_651655 [Colletotrichum caudatum]